MCCKEPNIDIFKILITNKNINKNIKNKKNDTCKNILKTYEKQLGKDKIKNKKAYDMICQMLKLLE